jgi:hypothetical protein
MGDRSGNLCPRAQLGMLRGAAVTMAIALAATVVLVETEVGLPWRFGVVVLFLAAFLQLFQAFMGTCVFRAAAGKRVTNQGSEPIANPAELGRIRRRARGIFAASLASALLATGLVAALS